MRAIHQISTERLDYKYCLQYILLYNMRINETYLGIKWNIYKINTLYSLCVEENFSDKIVQAAISILVYIFGGTKQLLLSSSPLFVSATRKILLTIYMCRLSNMAHIYKFRSSNLHIDEKIYGNFVARILYIMMEIFTNKVVKCYKYSQ